MEKIKIVQTELDRELEMLALYMRNINILHQGNISYISLTELLSYLVSAMQSVSKILALRGVLWTKKE